MNDLAEVATMAGTVEPPAPQQPTQALTPRPAAPPPAAITPMQMLQIALERGHDVATLEKLMALQERWEANEARKAFVAALSAFKADPPTIVKNKHVSFISERTQKETEYDHATLDQVASVIGAALSRHGLSHRWVTEQMDGGLIRVSCILQHVLGHSERVTLQASPDQSGGKNNIQAVGSTATYLERYTLLAAVGLAAKDQDDDGDAGSAGEMLSADEKQQLVDLLRETGSDVQRFLAYFRVESLDKLPLARFAEATTLLTQKKTAQQKTEIDKAQGDQRPDEPPKDAPRGPAFVPMKPPPADSADKAWRTFGAQLVAQFKMIAKPQREAWLGAQAGAFDAIKARSAQLHKWVMDQIEPPGTGDAR